MSNALLAEIGRSFGNISTSIAASANSGEAPLEALHAAFGQELLRLNSAGKEGIAGAVSHCRSNLARLISEGW